MYMNTFGLLKNALDAATLRQQVYANNIANSNTPHYKRQDVVFESHLQKALNGPPTAKMGERHIPLNGSLQGQSIPNVVPQVVTDTTSTIDNNGNNVDTTNEMVRLAENQVKYDTLVQDVTNRLQRLRTAIQGG